MITAVLLDYVAASLQSLDGNVTAADDGVSVDDAVLSLRGGALVIQKRDRAREVPFAIDPALVPAPLRPRDATILVCANHSDDRVAKMTSRVIAELKRRDRNACVVSVGVAADPALRIDVLHADLNRTEHGRLLSTITAAFCVADVCSHVVVAALTGVPTIVSDVASSYTDVAAFVAPDERTADAFADLLLAARERRPPSDAPWQRVVSTLREVNAE